MRHPPRLLPPGRRPHRLTLALASAGAALALGGCLGGGGGDATAPPDPNAGLLPASATTSVSAFIGYLSALVADDSAEPLDIAAAEPPTTETEEPLPVN